MKINIFDLDNIFFDIKMQTFLQMKKNYVYRLESLIFLLINYILSGIII